MLVLVTATPVGAVPLLGDVTMVSLFLLEVLLCGADWWKSGGGAPQRRGAAIHLVTWLLPLVLIAGLS